MLIISAIILNFTRAKYRTTQSIPLVNGTINYSLPDLNIVAITVDGESVDTIPDGNYELTEESYCTINGEKDSNIKISYDSNTKTLNVMPFKTKGTKCYLDFTKVNSAVETILENVIVNNGIPDFSKTSCTSGCGEATNGLYKEETSKGTTYYFRGTVDNNWVKFGDFYWRIIRINEDGSLRLIYQGTSNTATGEDAQIGTSTFSINSSTYNNNAYVGYMYTVGSLRGTTTESGIKKKLDTWYQDNLSSYTDKIDGNAGFCGDRTPSTSSSSINNSGGTGTTETYYGGYIRLITNKQPTFDCPDGDLYTTSGSSQGNKALQYPIGLISADEVAYAGGVYGTNNQSYYLYTGQNYWTMSPSYFGSGYARVFFVNSIGWLINNAVSNTFGVRPVINISRDVTITGSGTATDPYQVVL